MKKSMVNFLLKSLTLSHIAAASSAFAQSGENSGHKPKGNCAIQAEQIASQIARVTTKGYEIEISEVYLLETVSAGTKGLQVDEVFNVALKNPAEETSDDSFSKDKDGAIKPPKELTAWFLVKLRSDAYQAGKAKNKQCEFVSAELVDAAG